MPTVEHNTLTTTELHEPKGIDAASANKVYVSDGAGSGVWKTIYENGWEDFSDVTTTGTPIALTSANTPYQLTNDGLGMSSSSTYRLPGHSTIFNTSTGQFDFSSLTVGDSVDMRIDLTPTTGGANHRLELDMDFAIGGSGPFTLPIEAALVKTASTARFVTMFSFYIGSEDIRTNPAQLTMQSDSTGDSVVVNGWFVRTFPFNPVLA